MVNTAAPMIDTIDMEVIMHRDAHFGGSFDEMLNYYMQQGVGKMPDFEIDQMLRLQTLEKELGENLFDTYLPDPAKEQVYAAKKMYQDLRDVYTDPQATQESKLLSDLILSEEELPEKEIEAIVKEGKEIVPTLIYLLSSATFYEPLNPGYGRSPIFVAKCLAEIQDDRAIPPLFEALGQDNFFTDEEIIKALASFGERSKSFLIKRLQSIPFSNDNEYAAIALSGFADDPDIARASLELLEKEETLKTPLFASYLVFACSSLAKPDERERFINITKKEALPKTIFEEMKIVIKNWPKTA